MKMLKQISSLTHRRFFIVDATSDYYKYFLLSFHLMLLNRIETFSMWWLICVNNIWETIEKNKQRFIISDAKTWAILNNP